MGGREQYFVQQAFDTNWVVPLGPNIDGFEKDLEAFLNQQGIASQARNDSSTPPSPYGEWQGERYTSPL